MTRKILTILLSALLVWGFPSVALEPANAHILLMNPQDYAKYQIQSKGWDKRQFACLQNLWNNESHWNPAAYDYTPVYWFLNGKWVPLHAVGIAQRVGEKSKDAHTQILHGLSYIQNRYGTPCAAWSFWQRQAQRGTGWY